VTIGSGQVVARPDSGDEGHDNNSSSGEAVFAADSKSVSPDAADLPIDKYPAYLTSRLSSRLAVNQP
jgi:hypothetical protein